nr:hypothetical protein [Nocardioides astragali]
MPLIERRGRYSGAQEELAGAEECGGRSGDAAVRNEGKCCRVAEAHPQATEHEPQGHQDDAEGRVEGKRDRLAARRRCQHDEPDPEHQGRPAPGDQPGVDLAADDHADGVGAEDPRERHGPDAMVFAEHEGAHRDVAEEDDTHASRHDEKAQERAVAQ